MADNDTTAAPEKTEKTEKAERPKTDPVLTEVMGLFKELSLALIENAKANRAVVAALVTTRNHEGEEVTGLIDSISDLQESTDALDNHVVGQNVMLSRINFAGDKLLAIYKGDATVTPPVPARSPTLDDVCEALNEFDDRLAEESEKPDDEDEPPMPEPGQEESSAPAMIGNTKPKPPSPVFGKQLPPPPVFGKK